jgi:phosphopantetheinyl transferase (holo-ACP synthase)
MKNNILFILIFLFVLFIQATIPSITISQPKSIITKGYRYENTGKWDNKVVRFDKELEQAITLYTKQGYIVKTVSITTYSNVFYAVVIYEKY